MRDRISLPAITAFEEGRAVVRKSFGVLTNVSSTANGAWRSSRAAEREGIAIEEMRTIGTIFLQPHIKKWASMISCPCWPEG
jgi:hypothetical protein